MALGEHKVVMTAQFGDNRRNELRLMRIQLSDHLEYFLEIEYGPDEFFREQDEGKKAFFKVYKKLMKKKR